METVGGIKELCKRFGNATRQPLPHSFRMAREIKIKGGLVGCADETEAWQMMLVRIMN